MSAIRPRSRLGLAGAALLAAGLWSATHLPAQAALPAGQAVAVAAGASGAGHQPPATVNYPVSGPVSRRYSLNVDDIRHQPMQRILELVRPELLQFFDLYLYVNKAPQGYSAQHMYIFERLPNGNFYPRFRWRISTGREQQERYFTSTPTGIYKLDPDRFFTYYESKVWDGVPMPFAMFLDYAYNNGKRLSGIAIHGTSSHSRLGTRASGGCIRLAVANAQLLFNAIRDHFTGMVPKFAWNDIEGRTSKSGEIRFDEEGNPVMERGFRVLVIIDDIRDIPGEAYSEHSARSPAP
jgi:lipoprotein-anchoring transpeptidase ErfK/SrfK